MRIARSRQLCLSCNKTLPRAAARCPWCISSTVIPAVFADMSEAPTRPGGRPTPARVLQ